MSVTTAQVELAEPVLPRPYDADALDAAMPGGWATIPVTVVPTAEVVASQRGLAIAALVRIANGGEPTDSDGCDDALWLVALGGRFYIHNGHHRWAVAAIRGHATVRARVVTPDGQAWAPEPGARP